MRWDSLRSSLIAKIKWAAMLGRTPHEPLVEHGGVQWAAMSGDHAPIGADQHAIRKDLATIAPEQRGARRLHPTKQDRETHGMMVKKGTNARGLVHRDSQHDRPVFAELGLCLVQRRQLVQARSAPAGPEIQEHA